MKDPIVLSDSESENKTENGKLQSDENAEKQETDESSSESLVEIRLNEYAKKSEISVLDIRGLVVKCSSCGRQINHLKPKEVKKHRRLGVVTCKECYDFYGSSEFSQDESGLSNYCMWCGNGGKLIVCDFCPNGFCINCVRRNFGRAEISKTSEEGWKCYNCNKKRLKPKVKFCDMIIKSSFVKKEKKKEHHSLKESTFSEEWLQSAFDDSEKSCKLFHKKMNKLKTIGKSKAKSLKHIVSKLEQIIENHKTDLKNTVECLSQKYNMYIDLMKNEKCNTDEIKILDDNDSSLHCENNINDSSLITDVLKDVINDVNADNSKSNEHSTKKDNLQELSRIELKKSLLQSSSDSEADVKESPEKNSSEVEMSVSKENSGKKESNSPRDRAKRTLLFSDASSNEDISEKQKPNLLIDFLPENEVNIETDPKLKLEPTIFLAHCDNLLPEGETSLKITCKSDDDDEKLEKMVNSLCKLPSETRIKWRNEPKDHKPKPKISQPKIEKIKKKSESSSSISLSSSDSEQRERIEKAKSGNNFSSTKPKLPMSSGSSSIESDSEEQEEKKNKKKAKSKTKEGDSSEDFQPRKKRKYDKLLNERISIPDDEKETKPKTKKATSKRKRVIVSSDDENKPAKEGSDKQSSSTDDSSCEEDLKKSRKQSKKRKRIKELGSSSDDEKNENTPGKGRKNIKKLISQKDLAKSTKEAQLEEKERRKRIQERQKLYNKIEDVSEDGKVIVTKKMVLEVDQDSKEEIVEIHPDLVCKLKPHQVNGVKFMWECTIETVKDLQKPGSGCILAHCMGLGKTLQVIAFLHTCLTNPIVSKVIKRGMVICPYNTALNWAAEFEHWLSGVDGDILVHQLSVSKNNLERVDILKYWFEEGGVIIVSYDIFRRLASEKIPKLKTAVKAKVHQYLLDPGPDIVVCDEGHVLKNESSAIFKATSKLRTSRRIVLTGTPLQNNLKEYHVMLTFVKPNLLGNSKEFRNRFVNPIINGQYDDSNQYDVKLMKKRIHILHKLLEGCVQRCDYSALTKFLPPKLEFVISVKLSEIQMKMYECYLEKITNAKSNIKCSGSTLFTDFNNLRCIWNHPYMCIKSHERAEYKKLFKDESDEEFINDETESSAESSSESKSDDSILLSGGDDSKKRIYKTRSRGGNDGNEEGEEEEKEPEEVKQWYHEFITEDDKYNIELSGKMVLLVEILKECEAIGDKIIVFSQSLLALDTIEEILSFVSIQPLTEVDKNRDTTGQWIKGLDYFRMDGATSVDFRKNYIDMFNDPNNLRSRLFLISTKAGSLGTNLIGANRVVIFDTSWNPSHDVQAIFRVYRFGQTKPVYIYRLLAQGTMEEKIYDRQVTKLSLSCRVVDEQQIDRHFSAAVLADLYTFDRNSISNRPTPMLPKDRLLAELLINKKEWIVTYHEHDSLLQNQTEEDLTEEERQAAWNEYENEREGRTQEPSNAFDFKTLGKEPDFDNIVDYDGNMIPDLKVIISTLYEKLKAENPNNTNQLDFKQRLLEAVLRVRHAFQDKHVKILRMKQEFVAQGLTAPNALNKYLEELTQALKSTGDYTSKLSNLINKERAEQFRQMNQAASLRNTMRARMPKINPQMFANQNARQRFMFVRANYNMAFRPGMPNNIYFSPGAPPTQPATYSRSENVSQVTITEVNDESPVNPSTTQDPSGLRTYLRNENVSKPPTITEVDDITPVEPFTTQNNNQSTVIIEEIA